MLLAPPLVLHCADTPAKPKEQKSAPEHRKYELPVEPDENVAYGPHRMQVIYFWRAKSEQPTPLLVYIHLARPATIPRARVAETGQKRIPII